MKKILIIALCALSVSALAVEVVSLTAAAAGGLTATWVNDDGIPKARVLKGGSLLLGASTNETYTISVDGYTVDTAGASSATQTWAVIDFNIYSAVPWGGICTVTRTTVSTNTTLNGKLTVE